MRLVHEERGIILSWIIKMLLSFAIFGVALFEAGAVIVSRVTVDRIAIDTAQEASLEYERTGSSSKAEALAARHAERNGAALVEFDVLDGGEVILVTIEKEAPTLFIDRIPGLKDFTLARATNTRRVT
ncbi:MAG TPA: hypothetical protein VGB52_02065 [Actinomycetota bacterium]